MATAIQTGERTRLGTSDFWGYAHEGAVFEGLMCYALELVASYQGGRIVSNDRKVCPRPCRGPSFRNEIYIFSFAQDGLRGIGGRIR